VVESVTTVGVAGLGYWGPNLVRNVNASVRTELAWLCDRDPDRLAGIGRQHPGMRQCTKLLASLHLNWLSPVQVRHFLVGGSGKSILYGDVDASERLKVYDRGVNVSSDPDGMRDVRISYRSGDVVSPKLHATEPLLRLVEHFADCTERRAVPIRGGGQGLHVVRILDAAQRSLARGSERVTL